MIYKFMYRGIPIPEKKMRLNYWLAVPSTPLKLMNGSYICCSQRLFSVPIAMVVCRVFIACYLHLERKGCYTKVLFLRIL